MDKKYIVKNCPSLKTRISYKDKVWLNGCSEYGDLDNKECCNITNCLIKQVIEKCREVQCPCLNIGTCCYECPTGVERDFASEIIALFEIEEVNNDR